MNKEAGKLDNESEPTVGRNLFARRNRLIASTDASFRCSRIGRTFSILSIESQTLIKTRRSKKDRTRVGRRGQVEEDAISHASFPRGSGIRR